MAAVARGLSAQHEYHVAPNPGHFVFMICPPELTRKRPELCGDAAGFDRVAFHRQFNAALLACLRAHLT